MRPLVPLARTLRLVASLALALMPAGGLVAQDRPLPDRDEFYARVRDNLTRAQRSTHMFAYKERRTDLHTNPFGKVGTDGTRTFEVYPSVRPQLTYRRLVELNGVPVSASELARQDREYRSRVAEFQRRAEGSEGRSDTDGSRARARAQRMIDDVVDTLEFTIEGRTTYEGRSAILIGFAPRESARPSTREGRLAQKFKGTVWVDEREAEVMRLEGMSFDDISFGFGIVARLGEGTTATVTRRPVGEGLWMPTELTLSGRGRAALFRRLVIDYQVQWFDYERLPIESLAPFLDARVHGQAGGSPQ